ncbi:ATP-grasp domain-containing protein [Lentzea sp. NPDC004782]|uniref:ATP-grasp domain-containing protein n=1 Tax=Lentzea sp. NPDC004782 TaxID=3154458 RepID=UPI0033B93379
MAGVQPGQGRRILVIEPMGAGLGLVRVGRELGFDIVVATFNGDDRVISADDLALAELVVQVDTNDEAALTEIAVDLHARRPFTAILPGFEFYVDVVARLADRLGLPGLPAASVLALRDKAVMRERAQAAGLRVPRHVRATSRAELLAAAEVVGFPAVLKPTDSAGSVHVSRVDGTEELLQRYEFMTSDPRTDLGRRLDGKVLLEELVAGPEVSVEGYVTGDEVVIVSVTAKLLGPEPYFVEVGHIVQADLDPAVRADVESYVDELCRALRLTTGPFHCELRLRPDGPVLIEIGARLPGGHIADLVELVTGVSLPRVMLAAYTGLDLDQVAALGTPKVKCAGLLGFTATGERFSGAHGLDELRDSPDVLELQVYVRPGDPLPRPDDFRARLGHVIFHADSYAAALERWRAIEREVRFV